MRRLGLMLFSLLAGSSSSFAQDVAEAHNLSNISVQGTARSMGFGNALGSVGGDFSSLSVNPAGIGIYRSSEITLTPSLKINATTGHYGNETTMDNYSQLNFNNLGIVLTNAPRGKRYDHRAWKTVSFGFGMNRIADFNNSYTYKGTNHSSSASLAFESDANLNPQAVNDNSGISNSLGYMGYQSFLLNKNANSQYQTIVPFLGGVDQQRNKVTNGGITEYVFTLGGNYREKLMLGFTIGIPVVNYHSNGYVQETLSAGNTDPNPSGFQYFNYNPAVDITGAGINAKFGAILKLSDDFRIGAALHTPTYYALADIFTPTITTISDSGNFSLSPYNNGLVQNEFDYHLATPWKGVLSATFMMGKLGFITADYEYVDYASMRYVYPDGIDMNTNVPFQSEASDINQAIRKTYKGASNVRLGAEIRLAEYFMIRAGAGYYGNGYTAYGQSIQNGYYTTDRLDLSLGAGFHYHHFFTDIAIVHGMYKLYEEPYQINYSGVVTPAASVGFPQAKIDVATNNVALTVGIKFDNGDDRRHRRHRRPG